MVTIIFKRLLLGVFALPFISCAPVQAEAQASAIPVVYSPKYKINVFGMEKLHPFDIAKYDKIYKALKKDGLVNDANTVKPNQLSQDQLLVIHTPEYLESLKKTKNVAKYLEAPQLKVIPDSIVDGMIVSRARLASGGTLEAARLALSNKPKMAINLGGGFHHAKPDVGEGFCIIADVPIAIKILQKEGKIKRALIIDTDIHQGNGTIACLPDDETTYTFSMHEGDIYPMPKEKGDRDIELEAGVTDVVYLEKLKAEIDDLFKMSKPNIVFHVAGCDALAGDPLANGKMTHEGIAKRDAMVVAACKKYGVPYVMTLSGGYSKDAWSAQYKSIKSLMSAETK